LNIDLALFLFFSLALALSLALSFSRAITIPLCLSFSLWMAGLAGVGIFFQQDSDTNEVFVKTIVKAGSADRRYDILSGGSWLYLCSIIFGCCGCGGGYLCVQACSSQQCAYEFVYMAHIIR